MELNLKGRKIVITGAGDGIGRCLAMAFADEGAHIAICARSEDRLHSLSGEIRGTGHIFHRADLTRGPHLVYEICSVANRSFIRHDAEGIGARTLF